MVFQNDILAGASGSIPTYQIDQSIRFNSADSPYLTKTFGADGGDTWTFSLWIKRGKITSGGNWYFFSEAGGSGIGFVDGTDKLRFYNASSVVDSTQVFRDVGAWYHFVFSNNAGTVTITVNNTAVEIGSTTATLFNRNNAWHIGSYNDGGNNFDGYMAEMHWVDGTALAPTDFGETNDDGVWVPKEYTGSYGTNGFYITGEDSADLGADYSGNGNDFTSSGLTTSSQVNDSPTDNYCVMSPLVQNRDGGITNSDGIRAANLELYRPSASANSFGSGTMAVYGGVGSSKLYYEVYTTSYPGGNVLQMYIEEATNSSNSQPTNSFGLNQRHTTSAYRIFVYPGGDETPASWTSEFGQGVYVGLAVDFANDVISANVDGTEIFSYDATELAALSGITTDTFAGRWWRPKIQVANDQPTTIDVNFGQNAFQNAPTGYVGWSTSAILTPTIKDGTANFQTTLYTGNGTAIGSGGKAVSQSENSTFQPDLVWIKERNGAADHALYDAVRGTTKDLASNNNSTETTETEGVTTFGSAGFTVGNLAKVNTSSDTYVAWQWKANGSGSSNEDGTINTTATSANTTAGFSMSTYTGNGSASQTVGHGLGVTPSVVLIMPRSNGDHKLISNWESGVTAFTEKLLLNDIQAADSTGTTQIIGGSSTTFTIGTDPGINGSGRTYVAYCWAEVEGYSKMGTYTGNGSTDGPFIFTGFKPAFVLFKKTSGTDSWELFDNTRPGYNATGLGLLPNTTAAEATGRNIDILSNGIKQRNTNGTTNESGNTYVFMAFAEHPFGGDGVAPATAR